MSNATSELRVFNTIVSGAPGLSRSFQASASPTACTHVGPYIFMPATLWHCVLTNRNLYDSYQKLLDGSSSDHPFNLG